MIIANYKDDKIIQRSTEDTITDMNGKFLLDEPATTKISLTDITSVSSNQPIIADAILDLYPDYTGCVFNALPLSTDFDTSASLITQPSRCQIGLGYNTCAILPKNEATDANGVLITDTIYLSSSSDKFIVYWKVATIDYSIEEVNSPSSVSYTLLSPSDIEVYISNDDGVTYTQASYLTPVSYASTASTVRLAFVNNSLNKIHLLGYAILY